MDSHLKCFRQGEHTEPSPSLKSRPSGGWETDNRLSAKTQTGFIKLLLCFQMSNPLSPPRYLFDGANHLELCRGVEVVALLAQQQTEIPWHVSSSDVHAHDGVGDGKTLVDGHHVGYTVPRIQHNAGGAACSVPETVQLHLVPTPASQYRMFVSLNNYLGASDATSCSLTT